MSSEPAANPDQHTADPKSSSLSEVAKACSNAHLRHLAGIAKGLSEVELRVLLELAARADPPEFTCRASTRVLAITTGCSRRNVQHAVARLKQRSIITTRAGTATQAAAFRVNFLHLEVASQQRHPGGVTPAPGVEAAPESGVTAAPGGGVTPAPPPNENEGFTVGEQIAIDLGVSSVGCSSKIDPTRARDDERSLTIQEIKDLDASSVMERVLAARPGDFSAKLLHEARAELHGYATKFAVRGSENPHPPDAQVLAQFLAVADTRRLGRLLADLMADRQTCYSYGWFVTVALQRIHGISPDNWKEKRKELTLVRNAPRELAKLKGFPK